MPRISQAIIVISGAITGLAAITALSYYRHRNDPPTIDATTRSNNSSRNNHTNTQTDTTTTQSTSSSSNRGRLRRSRHVRIRRNNRGENNNSSSVAAATAENDPHANLSDNEDDAEANGKMLSLFKEWGDDNNRNLLNLLHAISENQSRKGKQDFQLCSLQIG